MQRPRPLVAVRPTDSLASVVRTLFDRGCSMAPVLCAESKGVGRGMDVGGGAHLLPSYMPSFARLVKPAATAAVALNCWTVCRLAAGGGNAATASQPPQSAATGAPPSPPASAALGDTPEGDVLHTATIAGVLACLMRHFRASLASLPLLAQPLSALPIGTWSPTSSLAAGIAAEEAQQQVDAWADDVACV